jgi:hypothetical protein
MFLKKHLLYVIVFTVIWTIQLSQNYFTLFNPPTINSTKASSLQIALTDPFEFTAMLIGLRGPEAFQQVSPSETPTCKGPNKNECGLVYFFYISGIMTFSTGIFLTVVRMFEPLFRFLVLSQIYEFWGEIYKSGDGQSEEEKQIENDALSSFLSSSLNVELVYILLNSITTFSKRSGKNLLNDDPNFYSEAVFTDGTQTYMNPKLQPIDFESKTLAEDFKLQQAVQRTLIMH